MRNSQTTAYGLALALLASAAAGCESVFEVDNPNQLVQADLGRPEAATALVNGAEAAVSRGLAQLVLPASIASDELRSIGTLDYGLQLDYGFLTHPANEVTNSAFPFVAEGRFMADEAIGRLRSFDEDGALRARAELARAYLYGGIVYTAIADLYDDFVVSDRRVAAAPIGEAGMGALYDRAIAYLDEGLGVASATGRADLHLAILAQRARAKHARAVWHLLNPKGDTSASALVDDPGAIADARAAVALLPSPDWAFQFRYGAATVSTSLGSQINVRQEYRLGDAYVVATADNRKVASVRLLDPITGGPDPALARAIAVLETGGEYPPLTIVSARELRLILAEGALARGDDAEAARQIDQLRALDALPPSGGELPLSDLLRHSRRVNLFLQGRRLADHYRFGDADPRWQPHSDAATAPGTFLPIAEIERISNCHILASCDE